MQDNGSTTESCTHFGVGVRFDFENKSPAQHCTIIQHIVKHCRDHADFLNDQNTDRAPPLLQQFVILSCCHVFVVQALNADAACCVQSSCSHLVGRNVFGLRVFCSHHHQSFSLGFRRPKKMHNRKNQILHNIGFPVPEPPCPRSSRWYTLRFSGGKSCSS